MLAFIGLMTCVALAGGMVVGIIWFVATVLDLQDKMDKVVMDTEAMSKWISERDPEW